MKEALFYKKNDDSSVQCFLCPHDCRISNGKKGFCGVRANANGTLYSLVYGKAVAVNVDPIEKKPLYHFYPGSQSLSIATVGCNFKCLFCQNCDISQVSPEGSRIAGRDIPPENLIEIAKTNGCRSISYTYTEPIIYLEYAYDTAVLAHQNGITNNLVTNGFITKEAQDFIAPYVDAVNVDLKSFREDFYKRLCRGSLQPVLDAIERYISHGILTEITTLLIPGENDSEEEIRDIARFISRLSRDIPWHISRFHPQYKMKGKNATPVDTIERAIEIGKSEGLRFIYAGNVPGSRNENTFCPECHEVVIKRFGFSSRSFLKGNACQYCGSKLPIIV